MYCPLRIAHCALPIVALLYQLTHFPCWLLYHSLTPLTGLWYREFLHRVHHGLRGNQGLSLLQRQSWELSQWGAWRLEPSTSPERKKERKRFHPACFIYCEIYAATLCCEYCQTVSLSLPLMRDARYFNAVSTEIPDSQEKQRLFLSIYLSEYLEQPILPDDELFITPLLHSVRKFVLVSHLLWVSQQF